MSEDVYSRLSTGSAGGATDKPPPTRPVGFAPQKPKIVMPQERRVKKR